MAPPVKTRPPTPQEMLKDVQDRQKKQQADLKRLQKFTFASNDLSAFQSAVMGKAESWMRAARNVGSAYKMAAEEHKKALTAQSASDALSDQILFSILSVATVGAISWISSAIQVRNANAMAFAQTRLTWAKEHLEDVKKKPHLLQTRALAEDRVKRLETMPKPVGMIVEAAEDALQTASDKLLTVVGPALTAEKLVEANQDPQVFQNEEENKISRVKQLAFQAFSQIRMDWDEKSKKSLEFWDTYDAKTQEKSHAEWQREARTLAGDEDLLSIQEMADELERGFWKKYVLEHHSHLEMPGLGWKLTGESFDFVGYHVVMRLSRLGVTQRMGLPTKGPDGKDMPEGLMDPGGIGPNEAYVTQLVKWATGYQVKPLLKSLQGMVRDAPFVR